MSRQFQSAIVVVCLLMSVCGCTTMAVSGSDGVSYLGDGKFIDYGDRASHDRYLLVLGSYAINSGIDKTFTLKGLPASPFTFAIQIDTFVSRNFPLEALNQYPKLKHLGGTIIFLQLEETNGNVVFSYNGPLSMLNRNVRNTNDGSRPIFFKEPSFNAQGTRFTPQKNVSYMLRFKILKHTDRQSVELIAIGHSGWK